MKLLFCFFNDTATTEIYTLSLHDALPISEGFSPRAAASLRKFQTIIEGLVSRAQKETASEVVKAAILDTGYADALKDRKSTRLNSSHANISYAVFCLKKKKN